MGPHGVTKSANLELLKRLRPPPLVPALRSSDPFALPRGAPSTRIRVATYGCIAWSHTTMSARTASGTLLRWVSVR